MSVEIRDHKNAYIKVGITMIGRHVLLDAVYGRDGVRLEYTDKEAIKLAEAIVAQANAMIPPEERWLLIQQAKEATEELSKDESDA